MLIVSMYPNVYARDVEGRGDVPPKITDSPPKILSDYCTILKLAFKMAHKACQKSSQV